MMKYTHNKRNQSKGVILITALVVLQLIMLLLKLAPNAPGQSLSWSVVFLPLIAPTLIGSIIMVVVISKAFVDFTVNFKSDERDK